MSATVVFPDIQGAKVAAASSFVAVIPLIGSLIAIKYFTIKLSGFNRFTETLIDLQGFTSNILAGRLINA